MEIYGFAGPAGSGKDTCGAVLIDRCGFEKVSFAAILKRMLTTAGYPEPATAALKEEIIPELGCSWRHMAQTLGTEWGRNQIHPNLWVKLCIRSLKPDGKYVFTDVRFDNEAEAIEEAGGTLVHLKGRKAAMAEGTAGHVSEKGVTKRPWAMILDNKDLTLDELAECVVNIRKFVQGSPDTLNLKGISFHIVEMADV
jgi:hypothetical protein